MGFYVKQAGADAKLIQYGPLVVAYHGRHPIYTVPVARITAHATVPGEWDRLTNLEKVRQTDRLREN